MFQCGRTALHYAHGLRMLDVAKLLQNSGADKNILDNVSKPEKVIKV